MHKTFVGFGFGPIQSALFLLEAYQSHNFSRFVVSEVDQNLVEALRNNGGNYWVNIARHDHIDHVEVAGVELLNPREAADRNRIIDAIAHSDEMATALPSVNIYTAGQEASVVSLLEQGLKRRDSNLPTIIYAAENNNHAAEILRDHLIQSNCPHLEQVQVLNTVIGKMSGVITDAETIAHLNLKTMTPDLPRAILVEEFNRILISQVELPHYQRGIDVFIEKPDLLPFEEAKLYGHNAIHALIAYLGEANGFHTIAQAGQDTQIMQIARRAFIDESGAALIKRYADLGDPLFTEAGYAAYADDLLGRMINPHLNDLIERVGRDHIRKLGYADRLYGTMRLALSYSIEPKHLALGAAAGIISLIKHRDTIDQAILKVPLHINELSEDQLKDLLLNIWQDQTDEHRDTLISLTWAALKSLETARN